MLINRISFIDAQQWNMITVNTSLLAGNLGLWPGTLILVCTSLKEE